MPSKIKLSAKDKKAIAVDVMQKLQTILNGNFENKATISFAVDNLDIKTTTRPKIIISTQAGLKMTELVRNCTKEVGWHGFVEKTDDNTYVITDIVVYPQTVTGTTVNTDELEYAQWLMQLSTEEVKHMRFQGHSHVNMTCSPSPVDIELYNKYLENLTQDDFYIFFICNKRADIYALLYDLKTNIKYTTADIDIIKETDMSAWYNDIKENIKETYAGSFAAHNYGYGDDMYYADNTERQIGFSKDQFDYKKRNYGTFPDSWPARVAREEAKGDKKSKASKKGGSKK